MPSRRVHTSPGEWLGIKFKFGTETVKELLGHAVKKAVDLRVSRVGLAIAWIDKGYVAEVVTGS